MVINVSSSIFINIILNNLLILNEPFVPVTDDIRHFPTIAMGFL